MKILHIITGLETGGAERMLEKLITQTIHDNTHCVVSLRDKGTIGASLEKMGVNIYAVGIAGSIPSLRSIHIIRNVIINEVPDIIQAWMYHGNIAASLLKFVYRFKIPVIHNIRYSLYDLKYEKRTTRYVITLNAWLSKKADAIIYNSNISKKQHELLGFHKRKSLTISNGFDLSKFRLDEEYRNSVRSELNIPENAFVFMQVGRNHAMKGHLNFLKAAKNIITEYKNVYFVIAGREVDSDEILSSFLFVNKIGDSIRLLGERSDVEKLWNTADVAVLSSLWGEGFPNVVGEAMACGKPAIVTDVGDSSYVVGKSGRVVPVDDVFALTNAMHDLYKKSGEERGVLGLESRERIEQNFQLEKICNDYLSLYRSVLK